MSTHTTTVTKLEVGVKVELKESIRKDRSFACPKFAPNHRSAHIVSFLDDIPGGVYLDRPLRGSHYWNIEDIQPANN